MEPRFGYTFPAIRGVQAKRSYYASMCPLRIIPKMFLFDEDEAELSAELRAQRTLNKNRIPEISSYILENRDNYSFSAITASIDAEVEFEAFGDDSDASQVGMLHVPMDAKFIINDGQHRRAAIEAALKENPELGDESIAVVFYIDHGLQRCQQMFADLNRYAVRPSKSLGLLFDHRDESAQLARLIVLKSPFFKDLVEMERSTLSARSRKLFTLSAIHSATIALIRGLDLESSDEAAAIAIEFWEEVAKHMPEWQLVRDRKITSGEIRQEYIHAHGIGLHAMGIAGNKLLTDHSDDWKSRLNKLKKINWARNNAITWEGRAMVGGRLSKSNQNILLTSVIIKNALDIERTPEEIRIEEAYQRGNDGQ